MYTVEDKTYPSFKELTREYNRRECMAGMKLTKEFVSAYRQIKKEKEESDAKKVQEGTM